MLIKNQGIKVDRFFLPAFQLNAGDLIVINLHGGGHYHKVKRRLLDLFTGVQLDDGINIITPLNGADASPFRRLLRRILCGSQPPFEQKRFAITKALSRSRNVIFSLDGLPRRPQRPFGVSLNCG